MNRKEKRDLMKDKSLVCSLYNIIDKYLSRLFIMFSELTDARFNNQKNIYFSINHMCSLNYNAMKLHYFFQQFAHTIRQLLAYGSSPTISFQGKIKEISFTILNELISQSIKLIENKLFQLRFNNLII